MKMKYKDVTLGQVEAVWNKLGGTEGAQSFLQGNVTITVVKHTVDLAKSPRLPFHSTEVVKHDGEGVVEIELRSDSLYVDGKLVSLFLSEKQKGDSTFVGTELRQELENGDQVLLNSNVLDYLFDHPELFPEHWKKDDNGDTRCIYFWSSVFRSSSRGGLCVRYLCWRGGKLDRGYDWLDRGWGRQRPSASVAS
jgi:hypothetical protein